MDPDEEVVAAHVIRAGRTLVISEAIVSATIDDQLVRVAMMLHTNCRVKNSG